jgi:exodeoxyribonuclease-3
MRIATWNVNSVRLRAEQCARFVQEAQVDVLCLQEIKCREGEFPMTAFVEMGLPHVRIRGQKGYHGVAIASRTPLEDAPDIDVCRQGEARHVSASVQGVQIHNLYIPAGGDIADRELNPKFDHKLDVFERLTRTFAAADPKRPILLCGDLNVAPGEHDVWNHRHMSRVVSHTPIEVEAMETLRASLGFHDPVRAGRPDAEKLFSWWSYRAADFRKSGRGLRLDHLWLSPGLASRAGDAAIHVDVRGWERPSDHAPVTVDIAA